MSNKIRLRRGTDAERGTVVLDSGEPGWTTDTKKLYVGDGVTYGGIDFVDAIVATHTAVNDAHHAKYTDSESVTAVATADDYVKNDGDRMTGDFEMWAHFKTDKYLEKDTNLFLGIGVCAAGNLTHTVGNTGWHNIGIGYQSLYEQTTGSLNSAVGYKALYKNTSGYENVAIGFEALYSNISGYRNVAIGYGPLYYNTTGYINIALGTSTLATNTIGKGNTGIGYKALYSNISGNNNAAIGNECLYVNTIGNNNVAFGDAALYYNNSGSNNVAIGFYAGLGTGAGGKSGDVFIGYKAGQNENGSNKLYIHNSESATPLIYGEFDNTILKINGYLYVTSIKSGSTQANAGASAGEVWKTNAYVGLPDNVLMIGV